MSDQIAKLPEKLDANKTDKDVYSHTFKTPFMFEGETFERLIFDWQSLTAADALAIENELAAQGIAVVTPEFSGEYLLRMAARACTTRRADGKRFLGIDAYRTMPMRDYVAIRNRARSFLLRAES